MDFELRLLRHALALSEHRNFARAAKAVHVSQPTLSRSIQELEQRSGTRLFDRSASSGVEATDVGRVFLEHAREVISRASDFEREMDLLKGVEKGELHIGAGTFPGPMMVDTAIARLIGQHPSVRINVTNQVAHNLIGPLRRRELDLAVIDVTTVQSDSEMHVVTLSSHQGYVVVRAGHPALRTMCASPAREFWDYPLVMATRLNPALFKEVAALFGGKLATTASSKGVPSIGCDSIAMTKDIVLKSDAVAMMPLGEVIREIDRGELVAIPGKPWMQGTFGVVHLAHRSLSPLGETFVLLLKEVDAELLSWEENTAKKLFPQK
jgi:DNA-binding transcriptional LysR family regulator